MNILLINHYAGSPELGMEFRPYYMAKEWIKAGHQVLIVGGTFSHLRKKQPNEGKQDINGINYYWIQTNKYRGNGMGRIWSMFLFVFKLMFFHQKIYKHFNPDVVIASSTYPIDIFPARKIAKISGAKLCYEVHDLWPLSPKLIGGYSAWHPFIVVMQLAENYAYRHVDKVISLLWNAEQHMRTHGLGEGKFKCIPNGYSKVDWMGVNLMEKLPEAHEALFERLKNNVIIGFAGGFAASGSLDTLLHAAVLLKDRRDIHFILVGQGAEKGKLENIIRDNSLTNVWLLPVVNKKQIPSLISHFDITFLGGIHSILHKYGTSYNKLTDYMLSAKPIIQAVDEPNSIVEKIQCGIRVEAENERQVADVILKLINMPERERMEMGERGKKYVSENLEWGILARKFLDAMK